MATTADQKILARIFWEYAASEYPGLAEDDAFERFSVNHLLKPREISAEELEAGIVDGSKDGGVDSIYVFVNGALLAVDDPLLDSSSAAYKAMATKPLVEIFVIQSKNQTAWKEAVWEHLLSSLPNLLDMDRKDADLEHLYNAEVVERSGIIRRLINTFAGKFPKIVFRITYASRASSENLTPTVTGKAEQVRKITASSLTTGAEVEVVHIGATEMYALASRSWGEPATLKFRQLVREPSSFLGVVELKDYLSFVRNEAGKLREELFDSNVRDFEGDNTVNQAIGETLSNADDVEFWWLNNGVTVLGDQVDSPQQTLTISRPLIVNGLQTSHVLHRADIDGTIDAQRLTNGIVVRVIESVDEGVRDRIIAGTNRQTRVPGPALYATHPTQLRIEEYLKIYDLYYERRKNRYKNQGVPASKRVTMSSLAQAMITLLLGQPDAARARPSSILSRAGGYEDIFPDGLDLDAYLNAIRTLRVVDEYLRTEEARGILDEYINARFYVLAGYAMFQCGARNFSDVHFDKNHQKVATAPSKAVLTEVLAILSKSAKAHHRRNRDLSRDSMFKSSDFRESFYRAIARAITGAKKSST